MDKKLADSFCKKSTNGVERHSDHRYLLEKVRVTKIDKQDCNHTRFLVDRHWILPQTVEIQVGVLWRFTKKKHHKTSKKRSLPQPQHFDHQFARRDRITCSTRPFCHCWCSHCWLKSAGLCCQTAVGPSRLGGFAHGLLQLPRGHSTESC